MDSTLLNVDHRNRDNEELEAKIQELFTANRTIERLHSNVNHLEQENEYLKNALAEEGKLLEEAKKNENKHQHDELHRQMIAELRQDLDGAQGSEKLLREENVRLEKRLQQVLENSFANVTSHTDLDAEEILNLNSQISKLEEEKTKLQAELLEVSMNLQRQIEEKARLQDEISEKDEELECMESQFSTQCNISERLREENQELKAQFEAEAGQVDEKRKGNSLFSEVDDRRVAAESKVVQIHQQMKCLEEKLTKEQKENKRLKNQVTFLRQSSKKGFDEDTVKVLQEQLVQSKKTIADMTEKLGKLEFSSKRHTVSEYQRRTANGTDDDKHYIVFLEGLIGNKTKEIREMRSQAHQSHLHYVRTDLQLTQVNNDLQLMRHEVLQLKQRNSHLAMTLEDLRQKYGECGTDISSPGSKRLSNKFKGVSKTTTTTQLTSPQNSQNLKSDASKPLVQDASVKLSQTSKENVRLRDLVNLADFTYDQCSSKMSGSKSKGVQLSQEVKILSSEGDRSTTDLRGDGNGLKLKRSKGRGKEKFDSVTYMTIPEGKPSECNQQ